jgi:hypothetical protein
MKLKMMMLICTLALTQAMAWGADHDPRAIAALLGNSKLSLLEGISYAEQTSGVTTSAKFEIDRGVLVLSIYTIPEGLGVTPEKATLTELAGDATLSPFKPEVKVFEDKAHIARASEHMVLFQLSKLTLKQVIEKAIRYRGGTPIDVRNPTVREGRAIAEVVMIDGYNEPFTVTVDLLRGRVLN